MKRRDFIHTVALGLMATGLGPISACSKYARKTAGKKGKVAFCLASPDPKSTILRILDWDTDRHEDFLVPLGLPHSLVRDRTANAVFLFEVFGSCVRLDLDTKSILKVDHTQAREMFNGHGIQDSAGEILLCTQLSSNFRDGIVTFRDTKTLKRIAVAPRECGASHQIIQMPNSTIAACGNCATLDGNPGGGIAFLDYRNRKVLQRIDLHFPIAHMIPISPTEVIGIGLTTKRLPKDSVPFSYDRSSSDNISIYESSPDNFSESPRPLYYANLNGTHREFWDEEQKDLFQVGFGLARIPKSQRFLSSFRGRNAVILWEGFQLKKVFSVPSPTNIVVSQDESEFMVSSEGKLKVFSLETLSEVKTIRDARPVVMLAAY